MIFVLAQAKVSISSGGTNVEWDWSDYAGTALLILVLLFASVVVGAYRKGVDPLALLDRLSGLIGRAFGKK